MAGIHDHGDGYMIKAWWNRRFGNRFFSTPHVFVAGIVYLITILHINQGQLSQLY